jgi:hypothetical protein
MPFLSHPKSKGEKKENWLFMKTMSASQNHLSLEVEPCGQSYSRLGSPWFHPQKYSG